MKNSMLRQVALLAGKWIPALLLVTIFLPQGWSKFDDTSGSAAAFRGWGYPAEFRILIGVLELAAAMLLLWGRTAPFGAALVIVVMLGGVGTHVVFGPIAHARSEVVPIVLASLVLFMRRDQLRAATRMVSRRV